VSVGIGNSDEDSNVVVPATSANPAVSAVRIYSSSLEHARQQHGEEIGQVITGLPIFAGAIAPAVANPTRIETGRPGSFKYIDETTTNFAGEPLIGLTKIVSDTSARMQTLYFGTTYSVSTLVWKRDP